MCEGCDLSAETGINFVFTPDDGNRIEKVSRPENYFFGISQPVHADFSIAVSNRFLSGVQ